MKVPGCENDSTRPVTSPSSLATNQLVRIHWAEQAEAPSQRCYSAEMQRGESQYLKLFVALALGIHHQKKFGRRSATVRATLYAIQPFA